MTVIVRYDGCVPLLPLPKIENRTQEFFREMDAQISPNTLCLKKHAIQKMCGIYCGSAQQRKPSIVADVLGFCARRAAQRDAQSGLFAAPPLTTRLLEPEE